MRALVGQVFISELTAVFAHGQDTVPMRRGTERRAERGQDTHRTMKQSAGERRLPPPVSVIEVVPVVDHAERVVEAGVDHSSTRTVRGHALQTLCT